MASNAGVASRTRSKRNGSKKDGNLPRPVHGESLSSSSGGGGTSRGQMARKRRGRRRIWERVGKPDDDDDDVVVFLGEENVCEGEMVRVSRGGEGNSGAGAGAGTAASSSSMSLRKKRRSGGGGLKGKRKVKDDFVYLGEFLDERECDPVSSEQWRELLEVPPPREVIEIDDSDDDDHAAEEGLKKHSGRVWLEEAVDVDMEEEEEGEDKNEEVEERNVSADKAAESFGDDEYGLGPENPITIDLSGESDESEEGSESSSELDFGSATDTGDNESTDEDFQAEDGREGSCSDDGSTSYDDEDEKEEKERRRYNSSEKRSGKSRNKKFARIDEGTPSMEQGRNVETESSAICRKNGESSTSLGKQDKQVREKKQEKPSSSTKNDECGQQDQELWKDADHASVTSGECKMKGCSSKMYEEKGKKAAKKPAEKRIEKTGENDADVVEAFADCQKRLRPSNPSKDEVEKDQKKQDNWRGHQSVSVQKEKGDSRKIDERMENEKEGGENKENETETKANREHKDGVNSKNRERKESLESKTGYRDRESKVQMNPSRPKELHLIELLAECLWSKCSPIKDDSNRLEESDDVHQQDTKQPACVETLPVKFYFGVKDVPVEKTESEKELDRLWEEMETLLRLGEVDSLVGCVGTTEAERNSEIPATHCKHNFFLDEEIGIYCKLCHWIVTHIKDITPPFVNEFATQGSRKRLSSDGANGSPFDEAQFEVSNGGSEAGCSHIEGTVWDLIPDIKQNLYAHQQEGFEFLWTNLAGTMDLPTLKSADPSSAGGCIISHAPGTGKTRLTIVFLQTYLEVFPRCHPVIVAPASLLLTWEDEFKKWDTGIPFHNLNNPELSGKEHVAALKKVAWSANPSQEDIRMVKLYSWFKEKSILGISYSLYEKIASDNSTADPRTQEKNRNSEKEKRYANVKGNHARGVMGKILHEIPGLLVLDEGHTPRNQRSLIWKVLSEIQTQKRIILSGTPFQNNFLELYNTICLVKPSFPERVPQELKKFCQRRLMQEKKESVGLNWEPVSSGKTTGNPTDDKIRQLKLLMDPFVHVHKGSILQKHLPGLRDCVVTLMPDDTQKSLLQSIECSQNTLKFEHKLALVSVHPSLFLCCTRSEKEESVVDREQLEGLKLNPYVGVKTRFLVEFARMCEAVNEKVLVFSQFIDPLTLIIEQLKSVFNWSEGKEVFYMSGKLDKKQRQSLIHGFNDANSQAKILLASTKACSEGISLVGASRVVLLDVVWNPSVERQAISRAYRLGQKKVVYTYHLITHGTTEYTKYCKQAKKDRLSELVFSSRNTEDDKPKSSAVLFQDEVLDQMVQHDKLKDLFGGCVVQPKERDLFENYGS